MVRLSRELYRVYDQNGNKNCVPWSQTHLQVGYIGKGSGYYTSFQQVISADAELSCAAIASNLTT